MYKDNLALSNLQRLICHKTKANQILYILMYYKEDLAFNTLQWLIWHETTTPNKIKPPLWINSCAY